MKDITTTHEPPRSSAEHGETGAASPAPVVLGEVPALREEAYSLGPASVDSVPGETPALRVVSPRRASAVPKLFVTALTVGAAVTLALTHSHAHATAPVAHAPPQAESAVVVPASPPATPVTAAAPAAVVVADHGPVVAESRTATPPPTASRATSGTVPNARDADARSPRAEATAGPSTPRRRRTHDEGRIGDIVSPGMLERLVETER
jgi:hypothetical protein